MKNEFNHIRLREAREYKSISQTEMSKRIDVSLNSYKKLEAGEMILDNRMAHKVSSALDFEFDYRYFFTKSDIEIAIGDINFRSNVGYSKKREGIQRKNAKHLLEMYRFLTPYTKAMPQLNLPSIPNEYIDKLLTKNEQEYIEVIESISKYVRSFFGIGSFPLNKFSSLLETHGVILAQMDFKDKDKGDAYSLSAFDNRRNKMSMIVIAKNNKQTLARVNFNLAHELGHLVLHPFKNDMMEKQADNFAASFLMPRDAFLSDLQGLGNISMPNKEGRENLFWLKKKWGVSVAALLYRARALGFLDERNYKLSAIEYSRLGYKRGEPDDLIFILRNRVMEQIIKLYIEKRGFDSQDIMDIFRLRGLPLTIKQIENLLNFDEGEIFELVKVASKSRLTTTRKLEIIR